MVSHSSNGGPHAASWAKPRGSKYELSQRTNLSETGALGGHICGLFSVAQSGAGTPALMQSARNAQNVCDERSAWRSLVARRGSANYAEVARSNRAADPHPKHVSKRVVSSAQQEESVSRLASVALSVAGSAAPAKFAAAPPASNQQSGKS